MTSLRPRGTRPGPSGELAELTGGRKANDALNRAYDRLKDNDAFWKITMIDPGRIASVRRCLCPRPDGAAGVTQRDWGPGILLAGQGLGSRSGSRTLEEWMAAAQAHTTIDLGPFFRAWIYSPTAPARTAANGFRE